MFVCVCEEAVGECGDSVCVRRQWEAVCVRVFVWGGKGGVCLSLCVCVCLRRQWRSVRMLSVCVCMRRHW